LARERDIGLKLRKGSSTSRSKHRLTVIVNGGEEALRMTAGEKKSSLRLFVRQWLMNQPRSLQSDKGTRRKEARKKWAAVTGRKVGRKLPHRPWLPSGHANSQCLLWKKARIATLHEGACRDKGLATARGTHCTGTVLMTDE
jgi:hypothetical protein